MFAILVFIIVLSILVFIHELGHFTVAKKLGIRVEEFGFGLPPRIWGFRRGETIYSINWLPIGGFVRLSGEDIDESIKLDQKEKHRYFFARSKKERAAVLLAGVAMNFLLAVIILSYIFTQGVYVPSDHVRFEKISPDSPASIAGLVENDILVSFNGKYIKTSEELIVATKENGGISTEMIIKRGDQNITLMITPRKDPPPDQGPLGVVISNLEEKKYPWYQAPFFGLLEALKMSWMMLTMLGTTLFRLITFQPVGADVAGPIGIAQATGQAVKYGFSAVLQLMGILSLNLAIVNVLPIPALDGGRLLFVVLEKFIGKRVKPQAERVAHQIGMVFLLALIALITINDLLRIFRG